MDKQTDSGHKRSSFWKTLPGMLTAISSLVVALTPIIILIIHSCPSVPRPDGTDGPKIGQMDWIKGLKATADDRTYTILSGQLDPYPSSELLLVLKIRVSCKGIGIDFTQELFRLDVDGVMKAPPEPGSNYFVPPNSEYAEDVKFIIPKDSHVLKLQVGDSSTPRVAIIPLPLTKP